MSCQLARARGDEDDVPVEFRGLVSWRVYPVAAFAPPLDISLISHQSHGSIANVRVDRLRFDVGGYCSSALSGEREKWHTDRFQSQSISLYGKQMILSRFLSNCIQARRSGPRSIGRVQGMYMDRTVDIGRSHQCARGGEEGFRTRRESGGMYECLVVWMMWLKGNEEGMDGLRKSEETLNNVQ